MKPPPFDVFSTDCPSRQAFEAVFSRWGILTLARLTEEPVRFGVLHKAVGGISQRMLAQTLKTLEGEGLVERREYDVKPPRVEYWLSQSGVKLAEGLRAVIQDLYGELHQRAP